MTTTARGVALRALARIDEGAYANLALPSLLERSRLPTNDRNFATELTYGTTRMRRACDFLIDPYVLRPLDPDVRAALRMGAYQLAFLQTPPHAAVSATVEEVPRRARGLVNAILRRIADALPPRWPDSATRLSYPDWIVQRLASDLGEGDAIEALETMNESPSVTTRDDGYVQDLASQWVADAVDVAPGDRVADVCAAPGGKATRLASTAGLVASGDVLRSRVGLVVENADRLGSATLAAFVADGRRPPLRSGAFDRVLLDAPCSGLGVLRRRADARWRVQASDVEDLVALQLELLEAAIGLVRPGGMLVYSVCTLTAAETVEIDRMLERLHPELHALPLPGEQWRPAGRGGRLLPQTAGTDGMYVLRLQAP
ncbi:MAG: 16S rRNA (cytosine(967)-C(5))-methyltransferase [uncultured Acidimicrobiales bacterium]|uniref:16S rRNA (Cytosine(967)-C(5))-methyltransferase n=1 Tax=uncultured Acidimicrobiales bacterium TaxID=310071 RepID=A0A6J4I138_9ACTN|nr:MAG: 16S rRNA (cytosine(967)-C(5))-methyltransferase [uncultured Acidimicrobiales bacterium]